MFKPKCLLLLILLGLIVLGIACQSKSEKIYLIKIGQGQTPGEPQVKAMELFKEIVEEKTAGKLQVEVYPNNQLGNQRDVTEGIQLGTVQMASISSPMAGFVPESNLFELPFLFENRDHFYAVLDSAIGEGLKPAFARRGFYLLGYFDVGVRHIMTVNQPIHSFDDTKGLKIRTMENPVHLDAFRAFGANPIPMAYGELYTALEQGVIDGAEAANTNYYAKKFFEPAPYWAQVGWIHLVEYVIVSRYFFERLPDEYKKVIEEAAQTIIAQERQWYSENDIEYLESLKDEGVQVTYPERGPFREASRKVYQTWAEKVGGMDLINRILNYDYRKINPGDISRAPEK
ncbi:MAG: TRAP transporter substrate-binding protein [Candidatus Aminicenantes bacterium]|nr:TRAP transporter substrate-binding protein [Candidatus Aminicenantes bacterium]